MAIGLRCSETTLQLSLARQRIVGERMCRCELHTFVGYQVRAWMQLCGAGFPSVQVQTASCVTGAQAGSMQGHALTHR